MIQYYSSEKNVQVLISLMKQHNIKKVVVSPGSTNVCFVGSIQQDPFFEIYSCVDERSAAYMAVGLAAESLESVALSCTGATASRNYFPALTEAYYRKLPILAITASQDESLIGSLIPQVLNRSCQPKDLVKLSVHLQNVKDDNDLWDVNVKSNMAILELRHHGCGPVHVNLSTTYSPDYHLKELPVARVIHRYNESDVTLPNISAKKIAVYVGTHNRWAPEDVTALDSFCESYNAAVFCDPASNYTGKYKVNFSLVSSQRFSSPCQNPDLLIHIGNMSDLCMQIGNPKEVWRVSEDGAIADRYRRLTNVFEMPEASFFRRYAAKSKNRTVSYYNECHREEKKIHDSIPELPFSHIWVASKLAEHLPKGSVLHLGILAPLRSWSYFDIDRSIEVQCNEGGFGIDGNMSTMVGASLVTPTKIHFVVVGDLSFFYDINILGNRHVGNNVRILLVNNSLAAEFFLFKQKNIAPIDDIGKFISAENHFGHQSPKLVKDFATDLGFDYMSAWNKQEFEACYKRFITSEQTAKPMVFEVFTQTQNEDEALRQIWNIETSAPSLKEGAKDMVKKVLGKDNSKRIKGLIKGIMGK